MVQIYDRKLFEYHISYDDVYIFLINEKLKTFEIPLHSSISDIVSNAALC